jgi:3-oxoacyl-[acyl-carrier-protein] synthase III
MLAKGNIAPESLRFFQINLPAKHIVDSVKEELASIGVPADAFYSKLDSLGYCGPPMVFVCLDKMLREERLAPGERVVSFVTEVSKFMQAGYSARHEDR